MHTVVCAFKKTRAFRRRSQCYKCITEMLNDLLVAAESHPQAPSVPAQPGPPVLNSSSNASNISPLTPSKAQMHVSVCSVNIVFLQELVIRTKAN